MAAPLWIRPRGIPVPGRRVSPCVLGQMRSAVWACRPDAVCPPRIRPAGSAHPPAAMHVDRRRRDCNQRCFRMIQPRCLQSRPIVLSLHLALAHLVQRVAESSSPRPAACAAICTLSFTASIGTPTAVTSAASASTSASRRAASCAGAPDVDRGDPVGVLAGQRGVDLRVALAAVADQDEPQLRVLVEHPPHQPVLCSCAPIRNSPLRDGPQSVSSSGPSGNRRSAMNSQQHLVQVPRAGRDVEDRAAPARAGRRAPGRARPPRAAGVRSWTSVSSVARRNSMPRLRPVSRIVSSTSLTRPIRAAGSTTSTCAVTGGAVAQAQLDLVPAGGERRAARARRRRSRRGRRGPAASPPGPVIVTSAPGPRRSGSARGSPAGSPAATGASARRLRHPRPRARRPPAGRAPRARHPDPPGGAVPDERDDHRQVPPAQAQGEQHDGLHDVLDQHRGPDHHLADDRAPTRLLHPEGLPHRCDQGHRGVGSSDRA